MAGQMCWLSRYGNDGKKILHLRLDSNKPWVPYNLMPKFAVPDYQIPGGSKGWATYQQLLKAGWKLEASPQLPALEQPTPKAA